MGNIDKTDLAIRMKGYEHAFRVAMPKRMPVVIRLDGRSFHTYTKGLPKPWSENLVQVMNDTAIALCESIQGAQVAYVQSDEISILVHNYKKLESQAWFDNEVQKMASVSAGVASATFTLNSGKIFQKECPECAWCGSNFSNFCRNCRNERWIDKAPRLAIFDSRVFVLPENEVCNYFVWRQKDAIRNSVQMLARSLGSQKELHGLNNEKLKEFCLTRGKDWNSVPAYHRHGRCVFLKTDMATGRKKWDVDNNIPVFTQDREYINEFLAVEPEKENENT